MVAHWQHALKKAWGIEATLTKLDGEYDLNFLAEGDRDYVLKVMRAGCDEKFIDMQCQTFDYLKKQAPDLPIPDILPSKQGTLYCLFEDEEGQNRILWLLQKIEGRTYADFKPKTINLIHNLGLALGDMDKVLETFNHPSLQRDFKWNLTQGDWIADNLDIIVNLKRRALIEEIVQDYHRVKKILMAMDQVAIHNDVNDYNVLVNGSLTIEPYIAGLIDFGDMCASPRICDLAITAAYIVLDHPNPEEALTALTRGYHSTYPLTAQETDLIWPLLRLRLAVSVVNSTLMAVENPDDPYVVISQKPAWYFLEGHQVNPGLLKARLRAACNLPVCDGATDVMSWIDDENGNFVPILGQGLENAPLNPLSVELSDLPQNPFDITEDEAADLGVVSAQVSLGYYNEPRLVYTADAFRNGPWKASNRRTVHLGVDIFHEAGTEVCAPLEGFVETVENKPDRLDYGGLVILRHQIGSQQKFYTLYGHLNPNVCEDLSVGQLVEKGERFACLGDKNQNGGWAPHLHFQLALSIEGLGSDWPGAADPDEMYLWCKLCPNPAVLLNINGEKTAYSPPQKSKVLEGRRENFGQNLMLTYNEPVMLLRGWKHHLFDEWGRPYLDSYNNVPHVGHAHPRIQTVATDQLKRMNSNTRYLHPAQTVFADKILSKLPKELSVCFFVNSGTEANELALRLARAHSGGKDMITPDHGYHGNTTGAIDVSAYKFNAPGGVGQPDWVHLIEVADDYRGTYRRGDPNIAEKYAALVETAISAVEKRGGKLAGFIAETFPSVGGQIIPPKGYLPKVYERIRAAGGVCIADEVQTSLGRLGDYYFGFEEQGALPDIVVMGKPIGNGHPVGVLVTTHEIADSFAKGPEFFSTFGGSTLSCRIGKEVLDIVDEEGLMENARVMGNTLLDGLKALQGKYKIVGDVRGYGLFIGLDLVKERENRTAGTEIAAYVKNRMCEHRILMGSEGPADNILKIRPPMTIQKDDVNMILHVMDKVLDEAQFLMEVDEPE